MDELVQWYWDYGVKRGQDPSDPDRELRKISIGNWLDPIVKIIDRNKAIQSNINSKACLALWGPSQSGKSTMMSRYIDGILDDGSDSALTWSLNHKTRFSPPMNGALYLQSIAPDTLVFNPFNSKSDASGIATRYTLQKASDAIINPEFPIEIKFTTRAQIIQSLSLGYLSECATIGEHFDYTQESFMDELSEGTPAEVSPEAYWLLKDIANVIEFMKGAPRFNNLFKCGEWDKKIRKALVSSPSLLASTNATEKFMAKIFWDSADVLTKFYKEATRMLNELSSEWSGCKILATMEVGALLEDIDSFKKFFLPESLDGEKIKQKVSQLSFEKIGKEIHVFLNDSGSKIAGESFGYFQAICAELQVPLKQEVLESDPLKNVFLELAKKCDFLDFPGVSNKNAGNDVEADNNGSLDLSQTSSEKLLNVELFTRVFKQGKTQCIVYNYARKYGIDAFAILARSDRSPSKSSLLNAGIREWLSSFDPTWKPGHPTMLPVFVNMTFFNDLINNVSLNGLGSAGLRPYIDRVQELNFACKESSRFFATTYHQFPDGQITNPGQQDNTIAAIMKDPVFTPSTGMTEENIQAVYSPDGGLEYMFQHITNLISPSKRMERCRFILDNDKSELRRLITNQLPSDADSMSDDRKLKLRECQNTVEAVLAQIAEDDNASEYRKFAECIKGLFSATATIFDTLPENATNMSKKEINAYIKNQVSKWHSYKIANLDNSDYLSTEQKQTILTALRDSVDTDSLFRLIKNNLGHLTNHVLADAARYPFAIAFGNLLQKGMLNIESDAIVGDRNPVILDTFIQAAIDKDSSKEGSPYYHVILLPLIERLSALSENCKAGARPPQIGDAELKAIFDNIEVSQTFQIF